MDPKKKEVLIQSLWSTFLNFLQEALVKKALAMFIKTAASGGLKAWLIKFIAEELFEEVGKPTANYILVEVRYRIDVFEGKRILKRLQGAASAEDYDRAVDDIYS
jgi:hypothetical protein